MNATGVLKIVFGLILMLGAVYAVAMWWLSDFLMLLKGVIPIFVFLTGLVFLLLGFEN